MPIAVVPAPTSKHIDFIVASCEWTCVPKRSAGRPRDRIEERGDQSGSSGQGERPLNADDEPLGGLFWPLIMLLAGRRAGVGTLRP